MSNSNPETTPPHRPGAPLWVHFIIWPVLLGLLTMVALGLNRTQKGTVQPGEKAPSFNVTSFEGQEISLELLRGKVVVVNFWASWCKPCEQEAADLEAAWRFYQPDGDVVFLGVDYVDTEPEAISYIRKFDITFLNAPDLGTRISQAFRIKGVPETYFIDQDGVITQIQVGPFQSVDEIKAVVDKIKGQ